uniref:Uncharacterized protein n=2 Tax=viral metagenome TaxID=1070528 RepID=A0A6M3XQT6_9ZZZZ
MARRTSVQMVDFYQEQVKKAESNIKKAKERLEKAKERLDIAKGKVEIVVQLQEAQKEYKELREKIRSGDNPKVIKLKQKEKEVL